MLSTICAGTYKDSTQAASKVQLFPDKIPARLVRQALDGVAAMAMVMVATMSGLSPICTCNWLYGLSLFCPVQAREQAPSKPEAAQGLLGTASPAGRGHHKIELHSLVQVHMDVLMPNTVAPIPPINCYA